MACHVLQHLLSICLGPKRCAQEMFMVYLGPPCITITICMHGNLWSHLRHNLLTILLCCMPNVWYFDNARPFSTIGVHFNNTSVLEDWACYKMGGHKVIFKCRHEQLILMRRCDLREAIHRRLQKVKKMEKKKKVSSHFVTMEVEIWKFYHWAPCWLEDSLLDGMTILRSGKSLFLYSFVMIYDYNIKRYVYNGMGNSIELKIQWPLCLQFLK